MSNSEFDARYSGKCDMVNMTVGNNRGDFERPTKPKEEMRDCKSTSMDFTILRQCSVDREIKNRVKLYVLCEQRQWEDKGTGYVACVAVPEIEATYIVVRLEQSDKNVLESRILVDTMYQKQQETLIVWSETDVCDLALSFQDKSGCEEVWERICQIQGRDPNQHQNFTGCDEVDETDALSATSQVYGTRANNTSVSLPPCELSQLKELESVLSNSLPSAVIREKVAGEIEAQGYVPKFCELFRMCEDLENTEALNTFYLIARHLFMLNRNSLIEIILSERYFKDIVGMLEYDPFRVAPRKHREFLFEKARFREVLPINNDDLKRHIHQTYRVQYIQDVCLPVPSLFEENLLSVLTSYVFFHRVEIVNMLLEDKPVMTELFEQLKDHSISMDRRKDLTVFLKEFLTFSSSLQQSGPRGRDAFYRSLMQYDVMAIIDPGITSKSEYIRSTTIELFSMIIEFNPQAARDYILQQGRSLGESKNKDLLINKLIMTMFMDRDPELSSALSVYQVLRTLLDPDSMITIAVPNSKSERHEFLTFFYRRSMDTLCHELLENATEDFPKQDDYYTANKQSLVIDLLCFCFEHHAVHMRSYCTNKKLLNHVLVLLRSKHHFLALSALRLFRRVVQLKDEFYFRYIVNDDVMRLIVMCFLGNGNRYNLLNSALLELFEYIRSEKLRLLIIYLGDKYVNEFSEIKYVTTFAALRTKYEQLKDTDNSKTDETRSPSSVDSSFSPAWKRERQADADEHWFNEDETENSTMVVDEWENSKQNLPNGGTRLVMTNMEDSASPLNVTPSSSVNVGPHKQDVPLNRKLSAEPNFPSIVRKRAAGDDGDRIFSTAGKIFKKAGAGCIVIKMAKDKITSSDSQTGSSSPPGVPIVSSTDALPITSDSSINVPVSTVDLQPSFKKALVDYDESDSDEEDCEVQENAPEKIDIKPSSSSSDTAVMVSSVCGSSQTMENDQDDVSSTSDDNDPTPNVSSPVTEEVESEYCNEWLRTKKRTFDNLESVQRVGNELTPFCAVHGANDEFRKTRVELADGNLNNKATIDASRFT